MLLTYLALRKLIRKGVDEYFVSIGLLSYLLTGKQIASQTITTSLLFGLNDLITKEYIIHADKELDRRKNDYILDIGSLQIAQAKGKEVGDYYSVIDSEYITKMLSSTFKDKIPLIRFYCYLMTTLSKTGDKMGVGFTSYENMATTIDICRQTVSKYMDRLAINEEVIYLYRSTDSICVNNSVRNIPNVYGDISIKDKVINVGVSYEENYGENAKHVKSTKKSSSRSASAKYNIILSDLQETGEVRYDDEVMKDIYKTLVDYNKRYSYDESMQKDLSVFSNFDFYNNC